MNVQSAERILASVEALLAELGPERDATFRDHLIRARLEGFARGMRLVLGKPLEKPKS